MLAKLHVKRSLLVGREWFRVAMTEKQVFTTTSKEDELNFIDVSDEESLSPRKLMSSGKLQTRLIQDTMMVTVRE